ncbi:MAG: hypothetical protein M0Z41_21105 [Peptococcaceae bacterium]|jgi:hypothetical protein|nr:hypothetical protein [Peptococcaceae bacterium]
MGTWESFTTAWSGFRDHSGSLSVAACSFVVQLIAQALLSLAGYPVLHLMTRSPFRVSAPPVLPFHVGGIAGNITIIIAWLVIVLPISAFVLAATPGSLLAALDDNFSVTRYLHSGAAYFWRGFAVIWLQVAVFLVTLVLSALVIFLFCKLAAIIGVMIAVLLLILPWLLIFGFTIVAMVQYLTNRPLGLGPAVYAALALTREKTWSHLGLLVVVFIFAALTMGVFTLILFIPILGFLLYLLAASAINVIAYLAVMAFAGLIRA